MGSQCSVSDNKFSRSLTRWRDPNAFVIPDLNKLRLEHEYQIGRGLASKVQEVRNKITMQIFVNYKIPKASFPSRNGKEISKRIAQLQGIEHPNVCRLVEAFDDPGFVNIIYHYVNGGLLFDLITKQRHMSEKRGSEIARQLLRALHVCYERGLIHGALVPKNILINSAGGIVITDFGLIDLVKPDTIAKISMECLCYTAPEIVEPWYRINQKNASKNNQKVIPLPDNQRLPKSHASDVWSVGAILFTVMSGKTPFAGKKLMEVAKNILYKDPDCEKALKKVSPEGRSLVASLLSQDVGTRPSAEEVLNKDWITDRIELLPDTELDMQIFAQLGTVHKETHFKKFVMKMISTTLTARQVQEFETAFHKADQNGDGLISLQELRDFCKKCPGVIAEEEVDNVFAEIDVDGEGNISLPEFIAATLDAQEVLVHSVLWDAFRAIDADHNGKISRKELKRVVKEVEGRLGKDHIDALLNSIDKEVNGEITFEQFLELISEEGARNQRQWSAACACCKAQKK
jgi:serine/threonine protein kinase